MNMYKYKNVDVSYESLMHGGYVFKADRFGEFLLKHRFFNYDIQTCKESFNRMIDEELSNIFENGD